MTRASRRGFTLAELLVGLVVTSIVMAAVTAAVIGVQASYQAETQLKVLTESGRSGLQYFERSLGLAGYGLDPRIAFDVTATVPGGATRENLNVNGVTFTPAQPVMPGTVITDDLSFRYRDPAWLRSGRLNAGATQLTLDEPIALSAPVGKLFLVVCRGANLMSAVRVGATPVTTATMVSVAPAAAPFVNSTDDCLRQTGAASPWVFMVHEQRLRVVNLGGRPWLVSFRNLTDNPSTLSADNFDPIVPDVENFQVAFSVNKPRTGTPTAPDTGGDWIFGDTFASGTPEAVFPQPAAVLTTLPDYNTGYLEAARFTGHPANIIGVHVALVVRTTRREPTGRRSSSPPDIFNYDAPASLPDGFQRTTFHTVVATPNLLSRSFFLPSLRTAGEFRDLNSWGG